MSTEKRSDWAAVEEFLAAEGLHVRVEDLLEDPQRQRFSALCYIEHDGRMLMLRRRKEPFAGHWTAPGGKLLPGEDPRQAVLREVHEETQLLVEKPELKLIASETGPEYYNWLLFVFRARPELASASDDLLKGARETQEGRLDWLAVDGLAEEAIPQVERELLPYVMAADGSPPRFARIRFAPDNSIAEMAVRPLERSR